ncbi:hypothetical protein BH11GEM1_BH11GEM1_08500 [soil metagenome]
MSPRAKRVMSKRSEESTATAPSPDGAAAEAGLC